MRGTVAGLESAFPLLFGLPAVYHGEEFTAGLVGAFDELVAPIYLTLDSEAALVDPDLTPADLLDWLGAWVGLEFDDRMETDDRRALIEAAAALHRRRGTPWALTRLAEWQTGGTVAVTETGGTTTSVTPSATLPDRSAKAGPPHVAAPAVHLEVRVEDPGSVDTQRLVDLVRAAVPVDCATTVEVVGP